MNGDTLPTIQPRRPQRSAAAPLPDLPEWHARPDSLPNLFLDLFDAPDTQTPAPPAPDTQAQTRIARGRARIAAITAATAAAREAAASPVLVNLWHDAFPATPLAPANDPPPPAPDEGRRLHLARGALYGPVDPADLPAAPSAQMRLAVHAMNGTLIIVSAPLGAAVMAYSLCRGEDLRLTARVMTACGALMTVVNLGLPLV